MLHHLHEIILFSKNECPFHVQIPNSPYGCETPQKNSIVTWFSFQQQRGIFLSVQLMVVADQVYIKVPVIKPTVYFACKTLEVETTDWFLKQLLQWALQQTVKII